ncbi:cytochrome P450 4c3-like [Anthonomus grandis grandis]|uniref:cytochrome P450 4c3-like n=1 Tax=Anthonomus grandis grandis TaxID=2921223 RepID=UPI002166687D|nr:cytochrome P450 4c3-like [Anthonomus grandis grandis]
MDLRNSETLFLPALIIVFLLILFFYLFKSLKQFVRYWILIYKLPTGHGRQFFFGHAGRLFMKRPEEGFNMAREWSQKAPPVYTMFLGPASVFVAVIGPVELEQVIGSMKHMEKSKGYHFLHRWLEQGLLTSSGSKWQKRRKILTPAFHFSILLDFVDTFNSETNKFLNQIESKYLNQPVNIVPLISDFTLLTMSETSMGTRLEEHQEGLKYKNAIASLGSILYYRIISPWLWHNAIFDLTSFRKQEYSAVKTLHNFTNQIIKKRSENFKTFNEEFGNSFIKRKHPLLDVLLNAFVKNKDNIDEQGIREEVNTFMFEGHDTTAMCLNFTTMLLACHREIQEEVYQEIVSILGPDLNNLPSYSDLQQLHLLERCIKEGLRLYPPVPLIARKASEDIETKYGIIPKDAYVFTHVYDVHRNPDHWPDPDTFDPSRHLPENSKGRHPFSYIPFSAGPRNCIGQRFAMLEMKSFFCGVLRKFILQPVDTPETITLCQDMIIRSRDGIRVKFELRNK